MEENRKHAILSASSAHRWLVCTPSARLVQGEREECSVYAQEGTAAHELAEIKLSYRFGKIAVSEYQERFEKFKQSELGQTFFSKEFEEYVDDGVEYVISQTEGLTDYHIYFELRVNFSNIVPQGFGTADVVIATEDTIQVIDLKFGAGVPVTAVENPQIRLYGIGALNLFPNTKTLKLTICQPRLFSNDTEIISKKKLVDWAINVVSPKADEAIKGQGQLMASEDGCRWCNLRGRCKARANMQLDLAREEFKIMEEKPLSIQEISIEQVGSILEMAPLFEDWIKDVRAHAYKQVMSGHKIPGFKLVEGRSNRIITDQEKVKEILMDAGLKEEELLEPAKMLGISKLEALVGKKLFSDLCQDYLLKPMGKLTLVPESDRRPEMSTLQIAQEEFK